MSDTKAPIPPATRSFEDIKKEYSSVCMKLGQALYHSDLLFNEIANHKKYLKELDQEASKLKAGKIEVPNA